LAREKAVGPTPPPRPSYTLQETRFDASRDSVFIPSIRIRFLKELSQDNYEQPGYVAPNPVRPSFEMPAPPKQLFVCRFIYLSIVKS
jgi:hypothetical protein